MAYNQQNSQQYPQQPQYPQQAYYGAPSPGGDGKGPQMYQTGGAPSPMAQQGYYAPPQGMYGGQQPMYYGQPGMQQHPPNVIVQQQPRASTAFSDGGLFATV